MSPPVAGNRSAADTIVPATSNTMIRLTLRMSVRCPEGNRRAWRHRGLRAHRCELDLYRLIRVRDRAPHVRDWAAIVAEPLLRLLEVLIEEIDERLECYDNPRLEGV